MSAARPMCCKTPHPLDDESVRACMRTRPNTSAPGRFRQPVISPKRLDALDVELRDIFREQERKAATVRIPIEEAKVEGCTVKIEDASATPRGLKRKTRHGLVQLGVSIPHELRLRAKIYGIQNDLPTSEVVEKALVAFLPKENR